MLFIFYVRRIPCHYDVRLNMLPGCVSMESIVFNTWRLLSLYSASFVFLLRTLQPPLGNQVLWVFSKTLWIQSAKSTICIVLSLARPGYVSDVATWLVQIPINVYNGNQLSNRSSPPPPLMNQVVTQSTESITLKHCNTHPINGVHHTEILYSAICPCILIKIM